MSERALFVFGDIWCQDHEHLHSGWECEWTQAFEGGTLTDDDSWRAYEVWVKVYGVEDPDE